MRNFFLDNFEPRSLFSWQVFSVSLVWAVVTNFLDVDSNPPGNTLLRLISVVGAHCVFFGAVGAFSLTSRALPRLVGAVAMVPVVIVLSMFRGWTLFQLLFAIGHDQPDLLLYRVTGSITNVAMSTLITAIVLHRVRTYSEYRRNLLSEQERLQDIRTHARTEIQRIDQETIDEIRVILDSALRAEGNLTAEATAHRIDTMIESTVRPLSHRLESDNVTWLPQSTASRPKPLDWRQIMTGALASQNLSPWWVGAALFILSTATVLRNHPPLEAVYIFVVALGVTSIGLVVVKKILISVSTGPPWVERSGFIVGALLVGALSGAATLPVKLDTDRPFSLLVQSPLYTLAFALLFALARSATFEAERATERLRATTAELAWEVARVSEEFHVARKSLARALHGRVQAGMMSSLMRLRTAIREGDPNVDDIVVATQQELTELFATLSSMATPEKQTLEAVCEEMKDTWQGVASCDMVVSREAHRAISRDPVVTAALAELIPELAFNAVKHGHATTVSYAISLPNSRTIRVACDDNGSQPAASGRVGLGTKLMDEYSLSWERTRSEGGTRSVLYLPVISP